MEKLPCGCQHGVVDDTFVYEPCALDCEFYLYVLSKSKALDKDVTIIDAR